MGKRNGKGMCIYQSSGDQYDGLWLDDEPHETVPNLYLYQPFLSPEHSHCSKTSKTSFTLTTSARSLTFHQDDDSSTEENVPNLPLSSLEQTLELLHTSTIKNFNKSTANPSSKHLISLWQAEKIEAYIQTARQAVSDFGYDLTSFSSSSHAMTTTSLSSSSFLENESSSSSSSSKEDVVEVLYHDVYNSPKDSLSSSKHGDICNVRGIVSAQSQCGNKALFTVFTRLQDG